MTPFGLGWPNVVSVARMLLAPVLAALILAENRTASYAAAAIFVAGAATDGLDGYLARRYQATSATGQWLDPLADKVLVSTPVLILAALGEFPWWAAVVIMVREIGISILRAWLGSRGRSMPASRGAKVKTTLQLAAVTLYLLPLDQSADVIRIAVLIGAVIMTVSTGLAYVAEAWIWAHRRAPRPPAERAAG